MKFAKKISPEVIRKLAELPVPWGPTGYVVYKRTYARMRPDLGRTEDWHETIERGCNGLLEIGAVYTEEQLTQFAYNWHQLKGCPAGRPIWQLGTETVRRLGGNSLNNCWLCSVSDPIKPFTFTFNQLMLGGGVGFNITPEAVFELPPVKYAPRVQRTDDFDCDFIVPDNREGWVELLRRVLEAFFFTGKPLRYDTRCIRPKGRPISGFGGIASGPEDLVRGIATIASILGKAQGRKLKPVDCLDILNVIGSVVVAGNVRRSAQIAIGDAYDREFLDAKNWGRGTIPAWRQQSNNSVACDDASKLPKAFWRGYEGLGEPYGLINLPLARSHGRLADGIGYRPDPDVQGTNPCVPSRTWVLTDKGPRQVADLVGTRFGAVVNGEVFSSTEQGFFPSGSKEVFRIETNRGYSFETTANHEILTADDEWVPLEDLSIGDSIRISNHPGVEWGGSGTEGEGWLCGHLLGNGCFTGAQAKLSFWGPFKDDLFRHATTLIHENVAARSDCGSGTINTSNDSVSLGSVDLRRLAVERGIDAGTKALTPQLERTSSDFQRGFLRGWFDADGTVIGGQEKGISIRLSSVNLGHLQVAQRMLLRLGIASTIYPDRHPAGTRNMPDGRGGIAEYPCQACHELAISRTNLETFRRRVGLNKPDKAKRLDDALAAYKRPLYREKFTAKITAITPIGVEDVYDCTIPGPHEFDGNGVRLSNCGEIPLNNFECCNLTETFLPHVRDEAEFIEVNSLLLRAAKAVTTLDYVDPESTEVVHKNRRIGMSVTGYQQATHFRGHGDAFDRVYRHLEDEDRRLSREMGVTPSIKLTTVKPSGSMSLLAGCTPGMHAAYAPYYIRRITFAAGNPLVDAARERGFKVEPRINIDGSKDHSSLLVEFPSRVPEGTRCAGDYPAIDQLEDQKFLQTHWADNSVSATIYYRKHELNAVKEWLAANYKDGVKAVSFLLHSDHGFHQAPFEQITEAQFMKQAAKVRPMTGLTDDEQGALYRYLNNSQDDSASECTTGACPIK